VRKRGRATSLGSAGATRAALASGELEERRGREGKPARRGFLARNRPRGSWQEQPRDRTSGNLRASLFSARSEGSETTHRRRLRDFRRRGHKQRDVGLRRCDRTGPDALGRDQPDAERLGDRSVRPRPCDRARRDIELAFASSSMRYASHSGGSARPRPGADGLG
jgi:hypothetical protein